MNRRKACRAKASQARMRGFESRHPLQKNLRPVFSSELRPTGGGSSGDRLLLHGSRLCRPRQGYKQMSVRPCLRSSLTGFSPLPSLEVSRVFTRFTLLWQFGNHENKNPGFFATFCDCGLFFVPSERKGATVQPITCVFASQSAIRHPATVPNRKKLQYRPIFLFWALGIGPRSTPYR